ncbi:MAG TPA: nicotinamide riboside transporter PnuC [Clostridia bacterium]|nr:nicotinamide riboside transporter PnuC [Clostridia bacterium]
MKFLKDTIKSFTRFEWCLLIGSYLAIILPFVFLGNKDYLTLAASLIGVSSLALISKGNVLGQGVSIVFGIIYAIIAYSYKYYGEMIIYLCGNIPICIASIIAWIKNPYKDKKIEVKISILRKKDWIMLAASSLVFGVAFYFILKAFDTNNLIVSVFSVFTGYIAAYLMIKRSEYYAVAYAVNDIALIILWALAAAKEISFLPMACCFGAFLANDIYGFINWSRTKRTQKKE